MKTYLKFACIYCGQHMECEVRFAGRQILCPVCMHKIVIPASFGGGPARQINDVAETWDTRLPLPRVETPTRYRAPLAANPVLAQRA